MTFDFIIGSDCMAEVIQVSQETVKEILQMNNSTEAEDPKFVEDLTNLLNNPNIAVENTAVHNILPVIMQNMMTYSTIKLESEPPEDETTPAPTGYDETLFRRAVHPTPRTKKYRKTDEELIEYYRKTAEQNTLLSNKKIESDKAKSEELRTQGNELYRGSQYPKAIEKYHQAICFNPSNPFLYTNRAAALMELGQYDAASSDCLKALQVDPKNHRAWIRLGNSYLNINKIVEAYDAYITASKIAPDSIASERAENLIQMITQLRWADDDWRILVKQNQPMAIDVYHLIHNSPHGAMSCLTDPVKRGIMKEYFDQRLWIIDTIYK